MSLNESWCYEESSELDIKKIKQALTELNKKAIIFMDLDEAILGITFKNDSFVLIYSTQKILELLAEKHGWTDAEAGDWYDHNIDGNATNYPHFID